MIEPVIVAVALDFDHTDPAGQTHHVELQRVREYLREGVPKAVRAWRIVIDGRVVHRPDAILFSLAETKKKLKTLIDAGEL